MLFEIATAAAFAFTSATTEVQVNICDSFSHVEDQLKVHKWNDKKPQSSYFIETPQLDLYAHNWVFKIQFHKKDDTVDVVLKNNAPTKPPLTPNSDERTEVKCENDLHGSQKKLACKMTFTLSWDEFDTALNRHDYFSMLSPAQQQWLRDENMQLPSTLEMTTVFKDQDYTNDLEKNLKMTLSQTTNANGKDFIEISIRTDEKSEHDVQNQLLSYLNDKNVKICADQGPLMTRLKLESFFQNSLR